MGTSQSPAEFSRKIVNMATVTQRRQREIVNQAALTVKEIVIATSAAKGVSPGSKIAGGNWGVRYDIKGFNNPTALVKIWGPFHLVDRPTKAHRINRKVAKAKGRGARRINRQQALNEVFGAQGAYKGGALLLPDGGYRHVVNHPGTQGKGIWKISVEASNHAVPIVMSQKIWDGWRQALK